MAYYLEAICLSKQQETPLSQTLNSGHSGHSGCQHWFRRDITDIKIDSVFESNLSLLLLTMPVAVWNMLRRNDAFDFVRVNAVSPLTLL